MTKKEKLRELSRFRHNLRYLHDLDARANSNGPHAAGVEADVKDANLITSEMTDMAGFHTLMIDLDVPATLVPSSTPGHTHLYVDVAMPWHRLSTLLVALADAGVVEEGYAAASIKIGRTALRPPWVKKPKPPVPVPLKRRVEAPF